MVFLAKVQPLGRIHAVFSIKLTFFETFITTRRILLLAMLFLPRVASAETVQIDGIYYNLIAKDNAAEVTSKPGSYKGYVDIPVSINYDGVVYNVTSIGDWAFNRCNGLSSVTIPNSVTSIGNYAFYECCGLSSITIPNSVTSIGDYAFFGCYDLTSITIGNSVSSIGERAFEGTAWYNNQPDGLVYAGKVAYRYKGTMPDGTKIEIAEGTFGVTCYAFHGCSGLTSITIPNSVMNIGKYAFYNCKGLTFITIGNGVMSIGEYAFYGCSSLNSITIPNSVTTIGWKAFADCCSLASVTIGNSVLSLENDVFSGCSSLTSVSIGSSVMSIGNYELQRPGIRHDSQQRDEHRKRCFLWLQQPYLYRYS